MPSGKTHDRITLLCLPLLGGGIFGLTQNLQVSVLSCLAFAFSGWMFGPDLDIHSVQFKRWGYLRIFWIPYQKSLRHRSVLSHGPIIGTVVRVLYLAIWLLLGLAVYGAVAHYGWARPWSLQADLMVAHQVWEQYPHACIAVAGGLELGAMSHYSSDWLASGWKAIRKSSTLGSSSRHKSRHRP